MTGNVAFAIGTAPPVDRGTTRFGVVTNGGTVGGVEALSEAGAIGVFESCAFGAGTGAIWGFDALLGLGQLGTWFAVTVIHTVTVVNCVCGVTVTVTVSVCA